MQWFKKRQYTVIKGASKPKNGDTTPPEGMKPGQWEACLNCSEMILKDALIENLKVCTLCSYNNRMTARERTVIPEGRLPHELAYER